MVAFAHSNEELSKFPMVRPTQWVRLKHGSGLLRGNNSPSMGVMLPFRGRLGLGEDCRGLLSSCHAPCPIAGEETILL